MSMFDDVFGGGQNEAAEDIGEGYQNSIDTYEKYLDQIKTMFQPWMDRGNAAGESMSTMGNEYQKQFEQMMGLGEGGTGNWQTEYTESPWAKYQTDVGTQAANANAASSGMLGSGNNQRSTAEMAEGIASKDRQQSYEDMMQMGQAATGNYSPLMQTGANMTNAVGGYTMGTGQEIGAAQQGIGQANAMGDIANANTWGNFTSAATGVMDPAGVSPVFGGGGGSMMGGSSGGSGASGGGAKKSSGSGGSGGGWGSAMNSMFGGSSGESGGDSGDMMGTIMKLAPLALMLL